MECCSTLEGQRVIAAPEWAESDHLFDRFERHNFEKLRERQIIVRHFKDPKICEYVRITIGTPEAMDALVEATKEILEEERQDA